MTAYRLDVPELHHRLDAQRTADSLTWRQLADQVGISASTFSRLGNGQAPDAHALVALLMWLDIPVSAVALPACGTCFGKPRAGFACLACGTEGGR